MAMAKKKFENVDLVDYMDVLQTNPITSRNILLLVLELGT